MKPVVAIYSTFLQRAYDQLIHDVALQNLPVVFAIDRAGIVGADGATHIGAFDLSYLRCLPNMTVMAPADENECRQMLYTAFTLGHAGGGSLSARQRARRRDRRGDDALPVGKGEVRRTTSRRTNRIAILAFGSMLQPALARRGGARRDGREHALRQAARRRARAASSRASTTRSSRSRKTSSPAARAAPSPKRWPPQASDAAPATRTARPVHRPWRSGVPARAGRARRQGHRRIGRRALRQPGRAGSGTKPGRVIPDSSATIDSP